MKVTRAFSPILALATADEIMSRPPALARIVRPVGVGVRVARFALPLDLCQTTNRTRGAAGWAQKRTKHRLAFLMGAQCRRFDAPLGGVPQVLCVRFSSSEPDAYSDFAKAAVDILCLPTARAPNRLGIIVDDKPSRATVVQWWEPAKKNQGFVVIEVWSGST